MKPHSTPATPALEFRPQNQVKKPYAKRICDEEWENHKPFIHQLHERSLTREEVVRALHVEREFQPTIGQLNKKMKDWDLRNYSTFNPDLAESSTINLQSLNFEPLEGSTGSTFRTPTDLVQPEKTPSDAAYVADPVTTTPIAPDPYYDTSRGGAMTDLAASKLLEGYARRSSQKKTLDLECNVQNCSVCLGLPKALSSDVFNILDAEMLGIGTELSDYSANMMAELFCAAHAYNEAFIIYYRLVRASVDEGKLHTFLLFLTILKCMKCAVTPLHLFLACQTFQRILEQQYLAETTLWPSWALHGVKMWIFQQMQALDEVSSCHWLPYCPLLTNCMEEFFCVAWRWPLTMPRDLRGRPSLRRVFLDLKDSLYEDSSLMSLIHWNSLLGASVQDFSAKIWSETFMESFERDHQAHRKLIETGIIKRLLNWCAQFTDSHIMETRTGLGQFASMKQSGGQALPCLLLQSFLELWHKQPPEWQCSSSKRGKECGSSDSLASLELFAALGTVSSLIPLFSVSGKIKPLKWAALETVFFDSYWSHLKPSIPVSRRGVYDKAAELSQLFQEFAATVPAKGMRNVILCNHPATDNLGKTDHTTRSNSPKIVSETSNEGPSSYHDPILYARSSKGSIMSSLRSFAGSRVSALSNEKRKSGIWSSAMSINSDSCKFENYMPEPPVQSTRSSAMSISQDISTIAE